MDAVAKSITKFIQDGQYFQDSRKWYIRKYIHVIREVRILAILIIIMIIIVTDITITLLDKKQGSLSPVYSVNVPDVFAHDIAIIKIKDRNPEMPIASKILEVYVRFFEEYDYNEIANNMKWIWQFSDRDVFNLYYTNIDLNNPYSFINRLKKRINRKISLSKIEMIDKETAIAYYEARFINVITKKIEYSESCKSTIKYNISQIEDNQEASEEFKFKIKQYKAEKLG